MYIYSALHISILRQFDNVLCEKIVLKIHLIIKGILLSLQKDHQHNKNLTKHQTKIITAVNTNSFKLQKS